MNNETIKAAEAEARRFLQRIKDLRKAQDSRHWSTPRESGAVRRASLDLTRALADLRRPIQ